MELFWILFCWMYGLFGVGFATGLDHHLFRVRLFTAFFWPFVLGGFIGNYFKIMADREWRYNDEH